MTRLVLLRNSENVINAFLWIISLSLSLSEINFEKKVNFCLGLINNLIS